jgi:Rieske Fe-S protein
LLLSACGAGAAYRPEQTENGDYVVPKSAFGEARALQLDHKTLRVPIVVAMVEGEYVASELICPHQGCLVKIKEEDIECPCHGSTFTFAGVVQEGPADDDLRSVEVEEKPDFLIVRPN